MPTCVRTTEDGDRIVVDYNSPRISSEVYECGMPLTFDQYSYCSFKCAYCFAALTKTVNMGKGKSRYDIPVSAVDVEKFKRLFLVSTRATSGPFPMIQALIQKRAPLHWGGLSDPLDDNEEKYKVGLEIIRFLTAMQYPVVLSTKGTLMVKDPWRAAFQGGLYRFQHSIITQDPVKAAVVDEGCPTPEERFDAIRAVSKMGFVTTLRLRPIIPGIVTPQECVELIKRAHDCGATGVSTEFLCAYFGAKTRYRFDRISAVTGLDVFDFYKRESPGQSGVGYMRMNPEVKRPFFDAMETTAKKLGMRFAISDYHGKERNNVTGCCAVYWDSETQANPAYPDNVPPEVPASGHPFINYGTITKAILIASQSESGRVRWCDIAESLDWADFGLNSCFQGLMSSNRERAANRRKTLLDALRCKWNNPNDQKSPYRYTYGRMGPVGVDENDDVVYEWRKE